MVELYTLEGVYNYGGFNDSKSLRRRFKRGLFEI